MSWLKNVGSNRHVAPPVVDGKPAAPKVEAPGIDTTAFAGVSVSEKTLVKYGAKLQPAIADMQAVGRFALAMRPHKAVQFTYALDRFYGDLAKFADKDKGDNRQEIVRGSVLALKAVVERLGAGDRLIPAIETLSALMFGGGVGPIKFNERAVAASSELSLLLDQLEGKVGSGGMLLGFRNLIELGSKGLEKSPLAERVAIWEAARTFLLGSSPTQGLSQGELGALIGVYVDALKQEPDRKLAFALASEQAIAPHRPAIAATVEQMRALPALPEGTPGRAAIESLFPALEALLTQHPVGPRSLLEAIEGLVGALYQNAAGMTAEMAQGVTALAQVIVNVAGQPSAEPVIRHLLETWPQLLASPAASAILAKVGATGDVARALIDARGQIVGQDGAALEQAVAQIDRMAPSLGMAAALGALPYLAGEYAAPITTAIVQFAKTAETLDQIRTFATNFANAYPTMSATIGAERALSAASAFASDFERPFDNARLNFVAQSAAQIIALIPGIDLGRVMRAEKNSETGLLGLEPTNVQGRQPMLYAARLLQPIAAAANLNDDARAVLVRRALHVADQIARLDRDPETVMPGLLAAWTTALDDPNRLHSALRGGNAIGIQGQAPASVLGFLDAHPELAPELAVTAGIHLSSEQLGWVIDSLKSERSRVKVRILRDAIFALVEVGRVDLLDSVRSVAVPSKTKDAVLAYFAQESKFGRFAQINLDGIRDALAAGRDPIAEMQAERDAATLAAILPGAGAVGVLDPEGLASIERCRATVNTFLGIFGAATHWNQPVELFKAPLFAYLRAVAEGTVKQYKYNNEVSMAQLSKLSPEAKEIWSTEGVTGSAPAAIPDGPELQAALSLVRGVSPMLEKVKLATAQYPELAFDEASRALLAEEQTRLLTELHGVEKGTEAHKLASSALGPISDRLSLIELKLNIDRLLARNDVSAGALLHEIKPLVSSAVRSITRFGGKAIAEALIEIRDQVQEIKSQPRQGKYAADEDRLEAYMTSIGGGSCITPGSFNSGVLVEKMAGGRYKMCRGMNGEAGQARSFLRCLDIKVGNYDGCGVWLDPPLAIPGGSVTQDIGTLMYKHALQKAMAMGVPFIFNGGYGAQAAQALGMQVQQLPVTVTMDRGFTGNHHTENLGPILPYGIRWPDSTWEYGYKVPEAGENVVVGSATVSVVLPPGMAI